MASMNSFRGYRLFLVAAPEYFESRIFDSFLFEDKKLLLNVFETLYLLNKGLLEVEMENARREILELMEEKPKVVG